MSFQRMRRRAGPLTVNKVAILLAALVILFNEFLVYSFQSLRWIRIPTNRDGKEQVVILFVSDPQLIGMQDEAGFPVGPISRWDSDRYLRNTFSRVYAHSLPDMVVFLGDIMDEGSKATDAEYEWYLRRFKSIFHETSITKTIIVPGDNDIGGEGRDFRTPFKMARFEKNFENLTGVVNHHFVDFLKMDLRMNVDKVVETKQLISHLAPKLKAPFRVIVNHESITTKMKGVIYPILRMAQANLLFTGHWHVSEMFTCDSCLSDNGDLNHWPYRIRSLGKLIDFLQVDLTDLIALNEIMVPTCSYRMGVPNMGYGVAVFEKQGLMKYAVLWQPSRYILLYIYLGVVIFIAVMLLTKFIFTPITQHKYSYS